MLCNISICSQYITLKYKDNFLDIFGWAKVKDSPEVTIEEQTIGYLRIESGSNNLLDRIRESFSSKNGTNSEKKNIPYDELRDRRNNKKEYELFNEQGKKIIFG